MRIREVLSEPLIWGPATCRQQQKQAWLRPQLKPLKGGDGQVSVGLPPIRPSCTSISWTCSRLNGSFIPRYAWCWAGVLHFLRNPFAPYQGVKIPQIGKTGFQQGRAWGDERRGRTPIRGFLRVPAKISGFPRKYALPKCFVFWEKARICKNQRKSWKICGWARFVPLVSSPSARPNSELKIHFLPPRKGRWVKISPGNGDFLTRNALSWVGILTLQGATDY